MLKLVDRTDIISSDARRHWEKILQEHMTDHQSTMDDIGSNNAEKEKHSNEIEEKRILVSMKMVMVESRQKYQ